MNRALLFFAATACAAIAVSSACLATDPRIGRDSDRTEFAADKIRFTVTPPAAGDQVQLLLRSHEDGRRGNNLSTSLRSNDISGLDLAALRAGGPVAFAVVHEAGRLDCAGRSNGQRADGSCRFTGDPSFVAFLQQNGIARPTDKEAFELAMTGASRGLVTALRSARYATPTVDQLTELSAVGVDQGYIAALAAKGYRPAKLDDLTEFRAVGVTPDYIDTMSRAGFPAMSADDIVEFSALGVSPDYVRSLAGAGFGHLDADEVAELRALDITAGYVAAFSQLGYRDLPVDKLVELRALDVTPAEVGAAQARSGGRPDLDQLIERHIFKGERLDD